MPANNPLSAFDGQNPNGLWRLMVKDYVTNDGGSLNGWGLRLCTNTEGPPAATGNEKAFAVYAYDNGAVGDVPTQGNLTLVRRYNQVTPSAAYIDTTTGYDSYGRPVSVTDANNHTTTTAYHSFYGSVTSVTNALNHTTSYVHDPGWGVITQLTDPNNQVTELAYDGYGRLEQVWLPSENKGSDPASLAFVYDAAARPAWVKSRTLQVKGSSTYLESWQYVDGFGRTIQGQASAATGGNRIVTSQKYNNRGLLLYQSAPYQLSGAAGSGYSAPTWSTVANYHQFYYDELGRQTKDETRSQNTVLWDVETTYDAWTQQHYDANNHRRDAAYNAFGQLVQVKEYYATNSFYTTGYAYDLLGNLTQVTDHLSNVTSMSYDLLGRKTAMSDPDMGSWQYQYDAVGNLTGQRDGRSQWLYLEYDALNRLIRKRRDSAGSGPLVAEYGYDATGQQGLLSFSKAYDSAGTTVEVEVQSVAYDARNRLTQQQWVVNGSGAFRLDYAYNEADQRTSLTYPGGTGGQQGEVVSHSYNAIGQLTGVSGSGVQYVSAATYNAQGQLIEMRNDSGANGLTRQFVYETNTLRLSTLQAGAASPYENLQKLSYSYDNAGNLTSLTDTLNSSQKQCFQYDWLDRLTAAFTGNGDCSAYSATGTGPYNHTYAYDAIGNITSYAGNTYTYGGGKPHAVTAAFGNSYSYDANGNQTSRTIGGTSYTFTFDYENRLTAISGGSVSASFVYDANGNRIQGTVGGVTTVYIAGIYEYQGGATTHYYEGNAFRRAGYASDNGVFYNLRDHLQSTNVIINQNGTLNSQNYYFPFGGSRGSAFSTLITKRFTGQYHEAGLPGGEGLSYYNARWYDAQLGRFVSADSIVPEAGNPQALNRYAYTYNNPLRFMDPTGHDPVDFCGDNSLCLAIFFFARSGNMYNTKGLVADWGRLRDEVWYYEKRPADLGVWTRDTRYPDVDHVVINRSDYIRDVKSRPAYRSAVGEIQSHIAAKFGNALPRVGTVERSVQRFMLAEAARADRYNAVEWFLGSHTYQFTVIAVNNLTRTATFRIELVNYTGWESGTREPRAFMPVFGTSVLPNRGGARTTGSLISYGLLHWLPGLFSSWTNYGATYKQSFVWSETIAFPYSEPFRGPR